ncbi:hypothetical protein C2U70_15935 [Bradyrhizobium guangdongense]|uniref:hypothetical protein n=1 Tax=Bradyrhizobium guangdongense TaxID=1325090 RepID=UPI00112B7896|nr:hypothetical protein [Bradyrhizobium guangdongense]TPQ34840.1 hypothetical protein C2U70_15935 [Bradyrhizobium guangdongense]
MADDHDPAEVKERHFRAAPDDLIIIPFVIVALVAVKTLRFILSMLMRLLDYAFPFLIQIVWLPLFLVRVLCNAIVSAILGVLRLIPVSETRRVRWSLLIRRNWSRLRRRISYGAFERAVHVAFEDGMAWVFRTCRHLTPGAALLVILGAVLWLPISFVAATALHAILLSKVASWPAWTQLFHAVATIIAKSKLLVLPAYPAAWPQAKKHPLVQVVFRSYDALKRTYAIRKLALRYSQAETIGRAAIEALERVVGVGPAVTWLRNAHLVEQLGVERPTRKLRSFFARWSIKFSAEYYEAKSVQLSDS